MAKFNTKLPQEIIGQLQALEKSKMFEEMLNAGARVVYDNIKSNMRKVFKTTARLEECLRITKVYRTFTDDAINEKIAFYGYLKGTEGKTTKFTRATTYKATAKGRNGSVRSINSGRAGSTSVKTYSHKYGTPAPLVAMAREYGTASGEQKRPFVRPAFNAKQITDAMLKVQKEYIDD